MTRPLTAAAVVLPIVLALAGCGNADTPRTEGDADALTVVATTPILGELTAAVVGEDATVEVLIPPGQDPHGYEPSAQQAGMLRAADLIVANGLGLEEPVEDAIEAAETDGAAVLRVGEHVDPLAVGAEDPHDGHDDEDDHGDDHQDEHGDDHQDEHGEDHEDEHGHEHGDGLDPHIWLDPLRMAEAATVIADALEQLAGAPDVDWAARGEAAAAELRDLHEEIERTLDEVPAECRVLVTAHDSLRYFAHRYDFEVVGSVVPGTSTQSAASAGHVAELASTLRERGVPAVFAETSESSRLADTLAAEVGREVSVVELPAGTLGEPGSETGTYQGMMMTTTELVADALDDC